MPNDHGGNRSQQIKRLREKHELTRYSDDKRLNNSHGKQLINLSKASGLVIANGRLGSDRGVGKFTRYEMSTNEIYGGVDYVLTTPALFDSIEFFEIGSKLSESDHLPIMFKIKCDIVNTIYSGGEQIGVLLSQI